ncbi:DUF4440 domain-containing protein [candidate division KSB1 bacterium]|nr:DUF4440 domain-containing protein [candidate division KSB1 bacterium]NIR69527.1 DUF4440 domain-containing protein [candidate division KSB1 bacterium]NIS24295.1 DUF4440 domain-containing protein [candidate division KSB1 bacterium]NIT71210.1 DUF4440 domain-containing protein [candidate division KSB1 bacterium]NIU24914.1 DUF4440 domain-containing protein [candidate division KSB1 bacterium]
MRYFRVGYFVSAWFVLGCFQNNAPDPEIVRQTVETVLSKQVTAWNDGDLEGFMAGYWHSDSLRFVSGGNVSYGWQTSLEHYERGYPDKAAMGTLRFGETDIDVLSQDAALVFGKWLLTKENDQPWGYFTLLFCKTDEGWRIVHDHTSSAKLEEEN